MQEKFQPHEVKQYMNEAGHPNLTLLSIKNDIIFDNEVAKRFARR